MRLRVLTLSVIGWYLLLAAVHFLGQRPLWMDETFVLNGIKKLLVGLLIGAFIFAAGMWYAKSSCHMGGAKMCPMSGGSMMAK